MYGNFSSLGSQHFPDNHGLNDDKPPLINGLDIVVVTHHLAPVSRFLYLSYIDN